MAGKIKDRPRKIGELSKKWQTGNVCVSENIKSAVEFIAEYRRVTIQEIAHTTGIAATQVYQIIYSHLNMSKLTSRWAPHFLTEAQKKAIMEA